MSSLQNQIAQAARDYHKTKDEKYKDLWYKLIRQWSTQKTNKVPIIDRGRSLSKQ